MVLFIYSSSTRINATDIDILPSENELRSGLNLASERASEEFRVLPRPSHNWSILSKNERN